MNYFDEVEDFDDETDFEMPTKKRNSKRRWRDIEKFKERRRLSKEIVRSDDRYFDLLEQFSGDTDISANREL